MNRFCLLVTLVVFGAIAQNSSATSVLNVAIVEGGLGVDGLTIAVDGAPIDTLKYKNVLDIDVSPDSELQVLHPQTQQLLASTSLERACIENEQNCSPLFVVFGGSHGRDIQVEAIVDRFGQEARRCTEVQERCEHVIHLAPIPEIADSLGQVFYRQRCASGSLNGPDGYFRSVVINGISYGQPRRTLGDYSFDEDSSSSPYFCELDSIEQQELGLFWPEVEDVEILPGSTTRFIFIGDMENQPLEVLVMNDTTVLSIRAAVIDPNRELLSNVSWFDPERAGHGAIVEISPDGLIATVIEYFFNTSGEPAWRYLQLAREREDPAGRFVGTEYRVAREALELQVLPLLEVDLSVLDDRVELKRGDHLQTYLAKSP